ncbi:MAG: DUF6455 family protein [Pseudomonadota bacterium]
MDGPLDHKGQAPQDAADPKNTPVAPLGDPILHYWLALDMAKTVGLDLQTALEEGRLTHQDWADTVHRCRGCDWAGGCPAWMAMQRMDPAHPSPAAPEACANAQQFNALLDVQDTPAVPGTGGAR